jgi:hypothetical protein
MGMPSGGGQAELSHVDARRSVQDTASTSAVAAMPTKDLDPMSPAAADESGTQYFGFLMGVTEYCESSEGTPLMAKGYWRLAGANDGLMITFSDGNTATLLSLNTGKQLQVGPCKCPPLQRKRTLTSILSKTTSTPVAWASHTETVTGTRTTGEQVHVVGATLGRGLAANSTAR